MNMLVIMGVREKEMNMSSGIVHRNASLMLAVGFVAGGVLFQDANWAHYSVGAMIGVMVSPDWDVDRGFIGDMYVRRLGSIAEFVWDSFLYVYRRSIKHGSPVSHWPILGTLGRIIYTYTILIFVPTLMASFIMTPNIVLPLVVLDHVFFITSHSKILIGLMASDAIHYILDLVTTNETVL